MNKDFQNKVKRFWDSRASKDGLFPMESLVNFEEDPQRLQQKMTLEERCIFSNLHLGSDQILLDLGAGIGSWSIRLSKHVKHIIAVERSYSLLEIARREAHLAGVNNITFINSAAEEFVPSQRFDIAFVSGLFVYLDDVCAAQVSDILVNSLKRSGHLFIRDGTAVGEKAFFISGKYSKKLNENYDNYAALYRTRAEYLSLFESRYLRCLTDGDFFPHHQHLNTSEKKRLRYYLFARKSV